MQLSASANFTLIHYYYYLIYSPYSHFTSCPNNAFIIPTFSRLKSVSQISFNSHVFLVSNNLKLFPLTLWIFQRKLFFLRLQISCLVKWFNLFFWCYFIKFKLYIFDRNILISVAASSLYYIRKHKMSVCAVNFDHFIGFYTFKLSFFPL